MWFFLGHRMNWQGKKSRKNKIDQIGNINTPSNVDKPRIFLDELSHDQIIVVQTLFS